MEEEIIEEQFDPFDESQVDLSGLVNAGARPAPETENETQEGSGE